MLYKLIIEPDLLVNRQGMDLCDHLKDHGTIQCNIEIVVEAVVGFLLSFYLQDIDYLEQDEYGLVMLQKICLMKRQC